MDSQTLKIKRKDAYAENLYKTFYIGQELSLSEIAELESKTRQSIFGLFKKRGFKLRTTPRLPFRMFNGVKFTLRNNGYLARTDGNRELMHRYMWKFYNGEIPAGFEIHHINENKTDNRLENFELISKAEHTRKYSPSCNQFAHRCGK